MQPQPGEVLIVIHGFHDLTRRYYASLPFVNCILMILFYFREKMKESRKRNKKRALKKAKNNSIGQHHKPELWLKKLIQLHDKDLHGRQELIPVYKRFGRGNLLDGWKAIQKLKAKSWDKIDAVMRKRIQEASEAYPLL